MVHLTYQEESQMQGMDHRWGGDCGLWRHAIVMGGMKVKI